MPSIVNISLDSLFRRFFGPSTIISVLAVFLTAYFLPFPSTYPKGVHVRRHVSFAAIGLRLLGDTLLLSPVCTCVLSCSE